MGAALDGEQKAQCNDVVVFVGEVEQAADLADGQADQAFMRGGFGPGCVPRRLLGFRLIRAWDRLALSTGVGSPF